MDDYPCWDDLGPVDRLRVAALGAELAGLPAPFLDAMLAAADLLEALAAARGSCQVEISEDSGTG